MFIGVAIWSRKKLKSKMPGIPDRQVFMCMDISVYACSKWMYGDFFFLLWLRCCSIYMVGFPKLCLARGRILISSSEILFIRESCSLVKITVHFVKHT